MIFCKFGHVYARAIVTFSTPNLKASPEYVNLERMIRKDYKGNIKIDSKEVNKLNRKDLAKNVALMSQASNIYFPYTVYETVALGRYAHLKGVFSKINKKDNEIKEEIIIHIAGEVKKPGIVKTKEGARIADIIEEAGGLTENANITNINLAYIIEDGQKITIPSKNQKVEAKQEEYIQTENEQGIINEEQGISNKNQVLNINKATKEELQTLQGIGESTADKIITYRKENGNFKQIEDIKNVPGIGDAKYENIKDKISVK